MEQRIIDYLIKSQKFGRISGDLKFPKQGKIIFTNLRWCEYLHSIFNFNAIEWSHIAERNSINKKSLLQSIGRISKDLNALKFDMKKLSLLHRDFNQGNLLFFDTFEVCGFIDWEKAAIGDPIYDFARFHFYLWQNQVLQYLIVPFLNSLNFTSKDEKKEELYFNLFIIHYLGNCTNDIPIQDGKNTNQFKN
jgi:thiamine kinase-like enzyme